MAIVRLGRGRPVTLFAPGGDGDNLVHRLPYAELVSGTTIGFAYGDVAEAETATRLRRQADRDAAEVLALVREHDARQAIGFSRGARAIVGALAEARGALFVGANRGGDAAWWQRSRVVLAVAGDWSSLVARCREPGDPGCGHRGDRAHPARVAQHWTGQLDARLELLPLRTIYGEVERVQRLIADFLN